MIKMPN